MSKSFDPNRIVIGVWGYPDIGIHEERFRELSELGVDMIVHGTSVSTPENAEKTLELGDRYGVEVHLETYMSNVTKERADAPVDPRPESERWLRHPSFAGHYFLDEPGTEDFPWIAKIANAYEKALPGKRAFVNLLPMYANAAQLRYGASAEKIDYYDADPALFRKYCQRWFECFDTNYICTDIYPLRYTSDHKKTTYADYVESIHQIAAVAREHDAKFLCCIQTFGWMGHVRTPVENEYRWQCYTMLSFGCTGILLWRYTDIKSLDGEESLADEITLRPTATYYRAKPVLREMHELSDTFMRYRSLGVFTCNCTEDTPWLRCSEQYDGLNAVTHIRSEDPLLFGCFQKREGRGEAFTAVNMHELGLEKPAVVRFRTDRKVTAWYRGMPCSLSPLDGEYTLFLNWGEGVFVTLDPAE